MLINHGMVITAPLFLWPPLYRQAEGVYLTIMVIAHVRQPPEGRYDANRSFCKWQADADSYAKRVIQTAGLIRRPMVQAKQRESYALLLNNNCRKWARVSGFVCPIIAEMLPKLSLNDSTSLAQIDTATKTSCLLIGAFSIGPADSLEIRIDGSQSTGFYVLELQPNKDIAVK